MKKITYICRPLLNSDEVLDWAESQGIGNLLSWQDIHVTVAYSRRPVETTLSILPREILLIGKRAVKRMGSVIALQFESPVLLARFQELRELGATWDYPSYIPHVTVSKGDPGLILEKIEPYRGSLVFGEEIMEILEK